MCLRVAILCAFLTALVTSAASQTQQPSNQPTLYVIPHTHWEGAVFETREEYLEDGLPHISQALHLLHDFPEYRFVLDQAAYVKPFLERYPQESAEFRRYVSEGRLQIVGGTDVMLDVNIPSGESWIRQVLYGKDYFRKALNVDVTTGWAIDTFGHHAQMPQLLNLAGFKSYWFQRGPHNEAPSEFLWAGLDGTKISAHWLALGYGMFYPAAKNIFEFSRDSREAWADLGRYSRFKDRVAVAGADVISPEQELPEMVRAWNAQGNTPFAERFAVPTDFDQVVSQRADRPVIEGELNPVFQGTYSNRVELKQWMREDEQILTSSEKLAVLAGFFGAPADEARQWQAWEPVLFNQAHDLTSGTMVDKVYQDTIRGYEFSKDLGGGLVQSSLDAITSIIDTSSDEKSAIPILVVNTLGWPRTDVAQAEVSFPGPGIKEIELHGPDGSAEPVQILKAERDASGDLRHATVAFVARDVPAIGWALYSVAPRQRSAGDESTDAVARAATDHVDTGTIENQFYRASFDLWTGAMTGLELKLASGPWQVLAGRPGNIVACEQDGGDPWELYGTLNGARLTAMTRPTGMPERDRAHFSNEWVGGSGETIAGPVFSQFSIHHLFGSDSFSTQVRVYSGVRRIDIQTTIINNDKFVRYRLLFPTSIQSGRRFDEIPFGAIERPEKHELPAQNWMDLSDGKHGLSLLNIGLPGSNVSDGTMLLSLMRSTHINDYGLPEGQPSSSDLGLELGQERTFHYALVPHLGNWQDALSFQAGLEFNNPLLVRTIEQHRGKSPKKFGLLEVSSPNVVLSALKPAQDGAGVIARVYEASGRAAKDVNIHFAGGVQGASEVNLMEDSLRPIAVENNSIHFDLRPFEIKTFRLQLPGAKP
jgi:alpha-mannosidase